MKQEEKIEVMLEAIFKSLDQISKKLDQGGGEELTSINKDLESLSKRLAQFPAPNRRELNILNEKLNTVIERGAYQQSTSIPGEGVKHHHYLWFFPDIKGWLGMVRSSRIAWVLGVLLAISIGFNYYIPKDYFRYQESDQKYQFIKHSGNLDYVHELDSIWEIDSLRKVRMDYVKEEEAMLQTEVQSQRKKMELRRQLDSLEQKNLAE